MKVTVVLTALIVMFAASQGVAAIAAGETFKAQSTGHLSRVDAAIEKASQ